MSIRLRSVLGAVALFGGILLLVSGGVWKSSDRIRYEREVEHHKPDPKPPQTLGGNVSMGLGVIASLAGLVVLGVAFRDMARQLGEAGLNAEAAMQRALLEKRDPKTKP
jgi:drug/metabolite transporter (DMT)-like permease